MGEKFSWAGVAFNTNEVVQCLSSLCIVFMAISEIPDKGASLFFQEPEKMKVCIFHWLNGPRRQRD
jgi:hypothetical protein